MLRLKALGILNSALLVFALSSCDGTGGGGGGGGGGGWDDPCSDFFSDCGGSWDDDWDNNDNGGWNNGGNDGGWNNGGWGNNNGGWNNDNDWGDDDWGSDDGDYCDGTGFCYSDGNPSSGRNIVSRVGEEEMARIQDAGKKFSAKFQLSNETGYNVARAFYDWRMLSKRRARNQKDVAQFTQRIYGVEVSRITMALSEMQKGNLSPIEGAIEDAADHWGTTPETMKEVLKDWYKDYLK